MKRGALGAIAAAAALAGCGGSSTSASAPGSTTSTTRAGTAAFASCMEAKGIPASALAGFGGRARGSTTTVPGQATGSPPSRPAVSLPAGVTRQQFTAALQACRADLPRGGFRAQSPAFAAYRNCLQLHGVTLPAGGFDAGSTTTAAGAGAVTTTPTTVSAATRAAAQQACAALRPTGAGGTASTTSTSAAGGA